MTSATEPTYIATRRRGGTTVIHLSAHGDCTLCGYGMSDNWLRHDERVALFTVLLSGVRLCRTCERAAIAARKEEATP